MQLRAQQPLVHKFYLYTFVAQFYPTAVRSTGMGWASGIGRIGAIVGPVLTGALLTFELPHQMNFLVIAIPGKCGFGSVYGQLESVCRW